MKLLILVSSLLSTSVLASQPSVADLSKLSITPVEALKLVKKSVTINGVVYQQEAQPNLNKRALSNHVEIPSLVIGEVVNSTNDLAIKIKKYQENDKLRKKIAKKGRNKYFKYFNSNSIADFIINKSFKTQKKFYWETKIK